MILIFLVYILYVKVLGGWKKAKSSEETQLTGQWSTAKFSKTDNWEAINHRTKAQR